jgi:hypothetical protein
LVIGRSCNFDFTHAIKPQFVSISASLRPLVLELGGFPEDLVPIHPYREMWCSLITHVRVVKVVVELNDRR